MTRKVICYHLYIQISKFFGKVGYNTENSYCAQNCLDIQSGMLGHKWDEIGA